MKIADAPDTDASQYVCVGDYLYNIINQNTMNKKEQVKAQIEWAIKVGILPRNYKKTAEYKRIMEELSHDE